LISVSDGEIEQIKAAFAENGIPKKSLYCQIVEGKKFIEVLSHLLSEEQLSLARKVMGDILFPKKRGANQVK
jgi:hypothetical protein